MIQHEINQIKNQLIGATILCPIEDGEFFGFLVATESGQNLKVWVDRDAEGNGCGHLTIEK